MSAGQFVEDVKIAVEGKRPVEYYGRTAGIIPTPNEIFAKLMELI